MKRLQSVLAPDGTTLPVRVVPARDATATLVLASGAGSSMKHPSLVALQEGIAAHGVTVATFDFPYRVRGGGAPDRQPVLVGAYGAVVDAVRAAHPGRLFAGGRSMGGRMASHLAAAGTALDGLVFVSFPLHPPGKPGIERAAHLSALKIPMLFVQGTRDTFAREDLLKDVLEKLPGASLHAIPDADHGMHVLKRSGRTDDDVSTETVETIVAWIGRSGRK
jgi:predicted alpha/beta-hydrolase family hydrolase